MSGSCVLFGDIFEWIGPIVTIVTILIYALNQLFEKQGNQNRHDEVRRQVLAEQEGQRAKVGDDLDSFLRDVAQNRRPQPPPESPLKNWSTGTPAPVEEPAPELARSESRVGAHVNSYLGEHAKEFTQHVQATVDTSDVGTNLDKRIQAKFDRRKVSSLADDTTDSGATPAPALVDPWNLAGLLSSPEAMRQAIIFQEVLERPVDRWS